MTLNREWLCITLCAVQYLRGKISPEEMGHGLTAGNLRPLPKKKHPPAGTDISIIPANHTYML